MGRFRDSASEEDAGPGIDMSPMMDCIFILLIFFIVTTTFVEESGVQVDKQQAGRSASNEKKTTVLLEVTAKGEVIYEGKNINIGGVQPLVKRMLQKEDVPVIVQAEAEALTGLMVRVIDEAKVAGATKVIIASRRSKN